ncbi:MAG: thioredoxin domain-containing protein [Microbacteriaceae bacterium]|nr:thioredoxin domain-containing protein [Microbacteriaceae bacterium]
MAQRLADSVSPYLRSHADNPVDWWPWGEEAFAEAARRDVPVLVSIGYATCHWCHVMARESFGDPDLAAHLNENLVAIKVDREEHPEVDQSFLTAASAFTRNLGWPLTVFTTPQGAAFFAGTYFPPRPVAGSASFRQVVDAVLEAWSDRRDEVRATADAVRAAVVAARPVAAAGDGSGEPGSEGPGEDALVAAVAHLLDLEDREHGGIGTAPKFPNAPVLTLLLERGAHGDTAAEAFARRWLAAMADSGLRDAVEGGFFRYATMRDWSVPHYERMATDNAQLLAAYTAAGDEDTAAGIAGFLLDVLRLPSGAFASAQDSESELDGVRSEGGYYALTAAERASQPRPALDEKVLTGVNGMVVGALAEAGARFGRAEWVDAAAAAADTVLSQHTGPQSAGDPAAPLARASLDGRVSAAPATLEDYGGLAGGLLRLALATGEVRFAVTARDLIEACRTADGTIRAPGGGDPVLVAQGVDGETDPSDGAQPSGRALLADAALLLAAMTGRAEHRELATAAMAPAFGVAASQPSAFGAALAVAARLAAPVEQLVVVAEGDGGVLAEASAGWRAGVRAVVTPAQAAGFASAGFELFEGRGLRDGAATAYLCEGFVCRLPITDPAALAELLGPKGSAPPTP